MDQLYKKEGLIDKTRLISFRICSVQYDTMKSCYTNILSDSLTFHTDLITEVGEHWRDKIETEIQNCGETAKEVKNLAVNIEIAAGADDESAKKCAAVARAQEQFYYEIDAPFRSWLESIDPTWAISSSRSAQPSEGGAKPQNESHCASVKILLNRRARRQLSAVR